MSDNSTGKIMTTERSDATRACMTIARRNSDNYYALTGD